MQQAQTSARDATAVQRLFNTATVTVGGLYLATHSVPVTAIGGAASTVMTCWSIWMDHRKQQSPSQSETLISAGSPSSRASERTQ